MLDEIELIARDLPKIPRALLDGKYSVLDEKLELIILDVYAATASVSTLMEAMSTLYPQAHIPLSHVLRMLSHEWRSPLIAILGYLKLLLNPELFEKGDFGAISLEQLEILEKLRRDAQLIKDWGEELLESLRKE